MGSPPALSVKGTLVLARLRYVHGKGDDEVERVLGRLPPDDQEILRGILLPSSWYPLATFQRLEASIVAVLARGDRAALFVDMGRASATLNLTGQGTQRTYLRPGDPHYVLQYSPHVYASAHNSGRRTYERTGDHSALLRTTDVIGDANPEDCLTTVGWLERAIDLAGGREVRVVETRCRARGDACCEYLCEWEPAGAALAAATP